MNKKDVISIISIGFFSGLLAIPVLRNIEALPFEGVSLYAVFVAAVTVAAVFALWICQLLGRVKPVFSQIGKFAAVGILNTLIDFAILNVLSAAFNVFAGPLVALFNAIGFIAANINSYFWNKHWTFSSSQKGSAGQFFEFLGVSAFGILLNSGIVFMIATYIDPMGGLTEVQWENVAKLLATVVSLVWNFIGYKFFVFRPRQ